MLRVFPGFVKGITIAFFQLSGKFSIASVFIIIDEDSSKVGRVIFSYVLRQLTKTAVPPCTADYLISGKLFLYVW